MPNTPELGDVPRVSVLGLGQMGLVCSALLASPDPQGAGEAPRARVTLWGHDGDERGALSQTRTSTKMGGFTLPETVRVAISDDDALGDADLVVCAIPVQFIRSVFERIGDRVPPHASVVSVSKGIENGTLRRPTQIIADVLSDDPDSKPRALGALSGPTIAGELARCLPATMVAASDHPGFSDQVQSLFTTSWLRVYTNNDLVGVELAGAAKNVIAIAAGIIDGLGAGFNAKSALLARGLAEIARLGEAMGAQKDTFSGVAGAGDLATTCFSPEGRNRSCGEALGRGMTLEEHLKGSDSVVEGVATARSVMDLSEKYRVEMPIAHAVHAVLFEKLDPVDAIAMLMSREPRDEQVG